MSEEKSCGLISCLSTAISETQASKNIPKKQYKQIPIVAHESELPSLVIEETNFGKQYKPKSPKKKFPEIPVVAHESEVPTCVFEENNFGKLPLPTLLLATETKNEKTTLRGGKKNQKKKKKNCNKEYKDIPVVAHESELPCSISEEYGSVKISCSNCLFDKGNKKAKAKSNKVYKDIPVVAHPSNPPTTPYEETNNGKQ